MIPERCITCGHDRASHYSEMDGAGRRIFFCCLCSGCECKSYVAEAPKPPPKVK